MLELRLSLVDIEILHFFLASWKGSEMERIWSDAISVVLHVWPVFLQGSAFSVRRVYAGLLMGIMTEIGT